jgi:hypothetical protein
MESPKAHTIFNASLLQWICVFIFVGIVILGLWPFTFWPQNQVRWLHNENGIRFDGRGLVYGLENPKTIASQSGTEHALTVDLWLKPDREPDDNVPVFLTIYDRSTLDAILLAQWRSELIVRRQNLGTPLAFREFGVTNVLNTGERRIITITFNASRTAVFVDGRLRGQHPANLLSNLDKQSIGWVLGNTPNGRSSWRGDVFAVALYDRPLTPDDVARNYSGWSRTGLPQLSRDEGLVGLFSFREHVGEFARNQIEPEEYFRIPRVFEPPQREILTDPWKDFQIKRSYLLDMAVNILGFIPVGFFFAAWFTKSWRLSARKAFLVTLILAAVLSLSIELTQAWIPSRDSQVMDLIMNTFGAALGALAFARLSDTAGRRGLREPMDGRASGDIQDWS